MVGGVATYEMSAFYFVFTCILACDFSPPEIKAGQSYVCSPAWIGVACFSQTKVLLIENLSSYQIALLF